VWSGAIGDVREVHIWTNRPLGYWPKACAPGAAKGGARPASLEWPWCHARIAAASPVTILSRMGSHGTFFLGAASNNVGYHPIYHPFNWRGWTDWGVGAIGDMGAHLIDHTMWALNLAYLPASKRSRPRSTALPIRPPHSPSTSSRARLDAARQAHCTTAASSPTSPKNSATRVETRRRRATHWQQGKLLHDTYGYKPRLLPSRSTILREAYAKTPAHRRRSPRNELGGRGQGKVEASCPFEYAARLTRLCSSASWPFAREKNLLRRHQHAHHQRPPSQRLFAPGIPPRLVDLRKVPEEDASGTPGVSVWRMACPVGSLQALALAKAKGDCATFETPARWPKTVPLAVAFNGPFRY